MTPCPPRETAVEARATRRLAPESDWPPPPTELNLPGSCIHVWKAALNLPAAQIRQFARTLMIDECQRAADFRLDSVRRRYVVSRGVLRAILGRYLKVDPGQVLFSYGFHGKPFLAAKFSQSALTFSVAHAGDCALYAFAQQRRVGVDLERLDRERPSEQLARRCFSERERTTLVSWPASQRSHAFLTGWTRKEAYLKARGDGLTMALDSFEVSLGSGEPAKLLHVRDDPREASRWSLTEIDPGPGYVATLAVEGHDWELACYKWSAEPAPPKWTAPTEV